MKTINKLVLALFLFAALVVRAADPDDMPVPGGDGTGTVGPGKPASPIDMYIYVLSIVAILFIVYYTKKYKSVKA